MISSKVRTADGRWLALDARQLHRLIVTANAYYTAELERGMYAEFGITAAARTDTIRPDLRAVREFAGVPEDVVKAFSQRRGCTEDNLVDLVADFAAREGRAPSRAEQYKLAQAAALADRPAKTATTVEGERRSWRRRAKDAGIRRPDKWLRHSAQASQPLAEPVPLPQVAAAVLAVLEGERSTWNRANVAAETYRQLTATGWHLATDERFVQVAELVAAAVLDPQRCVPLNPAEALAVPARYRRADGTTVFGEIGAERFTSHRILAMEADLVDAATRPVPQRTLTTAQVDQVLMENQAARGFAPTGEQRAAIRKFFAADTTLIQVIGRGGTGKTTIMKLVNEVATAYGIPVLGLAGGQVQADNLGREAGIRVENLARWRTMSEQYATGRPQWTLPEGAIVIIDESSQASSPDQHAILQQVQQAGGRLLPVGDPRQIGAPGVGGATAEIEAAAGDRVIYLTEVRRFRDPGGKPRTWEIDAATQLSEGDVSSYDAYQLRGRIHHGSAELIIDQLYADWKRDRAEGLSSVMIATNNATVAKLSARARADRVTDGLVDDTVAVELRDGNRAGTGDLVVTRVNNRRLTSADGRQYVRNGDLWDVTAVARDGALSVRHQLTGRALVLPADYVQDAVDLGYAITKDRVQGLTVDVGRALFEDGLDRNGAYPALTRGRYGNHAYLQTSGAIDPETGEPGHERPARAVWNDIVSRDGTAYSATATGRRLADEAASLRTLTGRLIYVLDDLQDTAARRAVTALLGQDAADQLAAAPAWPALRAQLAQLADNGIDTDLLLADAWADPRGNDLAWDRQTRDLRPISDIAAIIHRRNEALLEADTGDPRRYLLAEDADRPTTAPAYWTTPDQAPGADLIHSMGLRLPEQLQTADEQAAFAHALADAARTRAQRQGELALADAAAGTGWAAAYGPRPQDPAAAQAWEHRITAAAAWRDLARYTGTQPTDLAPSAERREERALWRAAQQLPDPAVRAGELAAAGPAWLDVLGPAPTTGDPRRTQWDQAAAALDAYRELWQYGHETDALGTRPSESVQQNDFDTAQAAVDAFTLDHATAPLPTGADAAEQLRLLAVQGREADERAQQTTDALAAWHRTRREADRTAQEAEDLQVRAAALRAHAESPDQQQHADQLEADAARAAEAARRAAEERDQAAAHFDQVAPNALTDREQARQGEEARRRIAHDTLHPAPAAPEAPAGPPAWTERPFGQLTDAQLQTGNRQALDAARSLVQAAVAAEERADQLAARALPDGEIERHVTARHARVQAITDVRAAEDQIQDLVQQQHQVRDQLDTLAGQLAATGRMGRPAVRGDERAELQRREAELQRQHENLAARQQQLRQAQQEAALVAGDPVAFEQVLAEWASIGGSREALRERMLTANTQDVVAARATAGQHHRRAEQMREQAAAMRAETGVRAVMDDTQLQAEAAARTAAASAPPPAPGARPQDQQIHPGLRGPDAGNGGRSY
jgi:hypothetical protein